LLSEQDHQCFGARMGEEQVKNTLKFPNHFKNEFFLIISSLAQNLYFLGF
jgi:hypothetical protein